MGLQSVKFKLWLEKFEIINEAKKDIVAMGYPDIIAKIFYRKFGNLAPMLSRWFRDYHWPSEPKIDWWRKSFSSITGRVTLYDLTFLHDHSKTNDDYEKALMQLGLTPDDGFDLEEKRISLEQQIERDLLNDSFFRNDFVKNIVYRKISDLAPYKNLKFSDAEDKYDKSNIFQQNKIIKTYQDGFKWIDVGIKCSFLGKQMKNCGSGLLYSDDPNKTMLALFGETEKPHVVLVYAPNEKMISGVQGAASTGVKDKYHSYVLDLIKYLGASLEDNHNKSNALGIKYLLGDNLNSIEDISDIFEDSHFKLIINGKLYYADKDFVLSEDEYTKAFSLAKQNNISNFKIKKSDVSAIFAYKNKLEALGIKFIPLKNFSSH